MADGQKSSQQRTSVHEAEELLRRTVHSSDDPFVVLSQSYRRKVRDEKIPSSFLDDDDER